MSNFSEELEMLSNTMRQADNKSYALGEKHGSLTILNKLMKQALEHKYETAGDFFGAISSLCDELTGSQMTSEQYEAEAKADNLTSEQFPNV